MGPRGLSRRQVELGGCVEAGMSNKEIAERMGLSGNTIGVMCSQIYTRLGLNGQGNPRVRLVAYMAARRLAAKDGV